jgi:hypothetical protein
MPEPRTVPAHPVRGVVAGFARTVVAVAAVVVCGAIGLSGGRASATGDIPVAYEPALGTLAATHLPVLLPTVFGNARLDDDRRAFVSAIAGDHRYVLQIDSKAGCNGGACSIGTFLASDAPVRTRGGTLFTDEDSFFMGGRKVALARRLTGVYFEAERATGGGTNSYLHFARGRTTYGIIMPRTSAARLTAAANSAIRNGVVRVTSP